MISDKPGTRRRFIFEQLETRALCASDWQNAVNHFDVDQSGSVVPLDVLLVINELTRNGARTLDAKAADYSGPLCDTSGDGYLSALDVLLVINDLNFIGEGDTAPAVRLPNQDGTTIDLASLRGTNGIVLYFYPKDDTPGCTAEALDFDAKKSEIESLGAKIYGVSLDAVGSHEEFADKHKLRFDILSDEQQSVTKAFGVLTETAAGVPIAARTTFIIGTDGIIKKVYRDVNVVSHGSEVVAALRAGIAS